MNRRREAHLLESAKSRALPSRAMLAAVMALVLLPRAASACTVCMGGEDSPTSGAINAAIFVMLGCLASMFVGLGGFAFYLNKRANTPLPPHVQFIDRSSAEEE